MLEVMALNSLSKIDTITYMSLLEIMPFDKDFLMDVTPYIDNDH